VLIVGPSGAGKDTLIDLVRTACADNPRIVFTRRVVTREASPFEDNETMTPQAFLRAQAAGDFAIHWEAHGHGYALRRAIDGHIRAGCIVVANVSRTVVATLRRAYADVIVVAITAPPDVLRARLAGRARGSDGPIGQRLERVVDESATTADVTIINVGDPDRHARDLMQAILR
jgi:ribose 1,5-bisphosphokinase